jgi:hypothetical protein
MFFTRSHIRTLFTGLEIPRYGHRRKVMRHCVNCSFFFSPRLHIPLHISRLYNDNKKNHAKKGCKIML